MAVTGPLRPPGRVANRRVRLHVALSEVESGFVTSSSVPSLGSGRVPIRLAQIAICALAIAGCSSARFGGSGYGQMASNRPPPVQRPIEPEVQAVPSGSVSSEPLPPPSGGFGSPPPSQPSSNTVLADVPVMPGSPRPVETMTPTAVTPPAGPSRSGTVGGYTARDATGATCRVSLSSTPALDLYRASSSGCANKDLAKVTSWDFRDGEVYLYQPGGSVAARLRGAGGELSGVLAKSGAPLTLTR